MAMDLSGHEGEIQIPITSTYVVHSPPHHPNTEEEEDEEEESKKQLVLLASNSAANNTRVVRYRECLKNHAASMGGAATDGCGDFIPSGGEGSLEALLCSACSCHRNFHRKESQGETAAFPFFHHQLQELHHYKQQQQQPRSPDAALIMPLGAVHNHSNYNDYSNNNGCVVRKRIRTKFTQEQREKMLGFAERAGWRLQGQEEGSVQQFCQETGVKRRVLRVWMHNNKHILANNKGTTTTTSSLHIQ